MPGTWDGRERRRTAQDHDTLIEVVQILKMHVDNFNKHVIDDRTEFKILRDQNGKHAMYIYLALGGIAMLDFLMKWMGK